MIFSEKLIHKLLNCPKEIVQAPGKPRIEKGHYRIGFELQSVDKEYYFNAFGRYNSTFPENFSVGLIYFPKNEKGSYEILRCNGLHGEHKLFPHHLSFHIHKITIEAIENHLKEDSNIEFTDQYVTFDDALRFFVKYINLNHDDIQKYFPGKDLQLNLFDD